MMPLTMASVGEMQTIKKVGGKQEVKLFLESIVDENITRCKSND